MLDSCLFLLLAAAGIDKKQEIVKDIAYDPGNVHDKSLHNFNLT